MTVSQPPEPGPHLVVLVHGINTWGLWMPVIESTLEGAGFSVARTSYGHFPIPRFLLPIQALHRTAINRVWRDIVSAIQLHKPAKISAITHSFGTHVLASILRDHPEVQWHRIIFCGSVLRYDFPFEEVQERFDYPLLNEVGTRDFWPALAESVTWGFGSAGSHGLNRPSVRSRWHDDFTHSSFLTPDFCRKYWIPFLRDGTINPASQPKGLAWYVNLLTSLPLRWILVAAVGTGTASIVWRFLS